LSELATLLQGAVLERHAGRRRNVLAGAWVLLLLGDRQNLCVTE